MAAHRYGMTDDGNRSQAGDDTLRLGNEREGSEIPPRLAVSLIIRKGRKKGAEYSITHSRTVLGRGEGADIIIDDPAVSRMHAAIEYTAGRFVLKDIGSTNGTIMDGKYIKQADLGHGDTFQVGDTVIEFALMERPGGAVYVIE